MKPANIFIITFGVSVLILAAVIGLSVHYGLPKPYSGERQRVVADCMPEGDPDKGVCEQRRCEWREPTDGSYQCIYTSDHGYYIDGDEEEIPLGDRVKLKRKGTPSLFGKDLEDLIADVEFHTESRVRIRITNAEETRFEVPEEAVHVLKPASPVPKEDRMYDVQFVDESDFGVKVIRRDNQRVVFDTTVPGLQFSDQYIHITTRLPSNNVYGFGEHNHRRFKHDMAWKKWAIFTRDVAPVDEWNLYGAQPMYMNLEDDGMANGVVLLNSNAMDVVLQPEPHPAISYHVIGGMLDFYVFMGPTPENVVQQYTEAMGRSVMPPYWSLGFQLSRWDYDNLTHVRTVVDRNRDAGIPMDVQYGDIDYMNSKMDFTVDPVKYAGLDDFIDELHSRGQRYIIILDHCIPSNETLIGEKLNGDYPPYYDGVADDIFIRDGRDEGKYLEGEVWPGLVHYPDFTNVNKSTTWWTKQCDELYNNQGIKYDALWIDMNEPSNFVQGSTTGCDRANTLNVPPYLPNVLGGDQWGLYDKTICMDAHQEWGLHYDVHSLYGHSMSIVTYNTLREQQPAKRPLVLTRSNFIGTQKYGQHWLGDNQSLWPQIPWSIVGMLEYSLFGFSYTGADICGFWYATTEEMCQRWMQLGAFYPFARNHNGETWPDQDPANFSPEMIRVSRDILLTRYKLLPFLYTLMYEAHVRGSTVVRPLLHEFPRDENTWEIDRQFLWGPSFMITPAMEQGQTEVEAYVPGGRWYDYYGGLEVADTGSTHTLATPLDRIQLHVRGGYIIPWQEPTNTTVFSRQNPMGLLVALSSTDAASGSLFWDDGESFETQETEDKHLHLEFTCSLNTLSIAVKSGTYTDPNSLKFETINIFGLERKPINLKVDGSDVNDDNINFDSYTKAATFRNLNMAIETEHTVHWEFDV